MAKQFYESVGCEYMNDDADEAIAELEAIQEKIKYARIDGLTSGLIEAISVHIHGAGMDAQEAIAAAAITRAEVKAWAQKTGMHERAEALLNAGYRFSKYNE